MTSVPPAVRKVSEAHLQKAVVQLAQTCGWRVAHFHDSRRQVNPDLFVGDRLARGFPDLVLVRNGRMKFIELKTEKGRVSPSQDEWLADLKDVEADAAGRITVHVWRPSHWDSGEIARVLARRTA